MSTAGGKGGPLGPYREKRDPARSNEPFAPEPLVRQPSQAASAFVVHEHHARHRHFDLRLEVDGVLKSFAVPRGPSLSPDDRRLAVQTEDHPLSYAQFEGVIPSGNYGAGPMIAWDVGRVRYLTDSPSQGLAAGKLDFVLAGYKLRGRFALVRSSGKGRGPREWLLLKKRDGYARPGSEVVELWPASVLSGMLPHELGSREARAAHLCQRALELGGRRGELAVQGLSPMACALASGPLDSARHVYELKLDGVRILADKRGESVALYYRKGRSATSAFADVARALGALCVERLVLDGEIVAVEQSGKPDFQRLARRFAASSAHAAARAMRDIQVSFVVFDILALGDVDVRGLSLTARKLLLRELLPPLGMVCPIDHIEADGRALWDFCRAHSLEGVVAKLAEGPYRAGPRPSGDWLKIKCEREDDFVVIGYTRGKGRTLGALLLASTGESGWIGRGRVGSGLSDPALDTLLETLSAMRVEELVVDGKLVRSGRDQALVRPELVVNVRHHGFTRAGSLRHPVFAGLRADVAPSECTAGTAAVSEAEVSPEEPAASARPQKRRAVRITNPNKVFWPSDGLTKGDLCEYYERVAPQLLPFLRDRPVILVRYPDGIEGASFYQWNAPRGVPSWVRTVRVRWEARDGKEAELFLIDDVETLLYIANLGCIPLHILAARNGQLTTCDFLTIDFDVGQSSLGQGVSLAQSLRGVLTEMGLSGFAKTSGQTGLHVLVPLGPGVSFDTAKALTELLGRLLVARYPDIATVERRKERRGQRVYVDTGQTGTTRAIVAPYSVRAFSGGRVSTPLSWDEVGMGLSPARFSLLTVPQRVREVGDLMAGFFELRPDIGAAVEALGRLLSLNA